MKVQGRERIGSVYVELSRVGFAASSSRTSTSIASNCLNGHSISWKALLDVGTGAVVGAKGTSFGSSTTGGSVGALERGIEGSMSAHIDLRLVCRFPRADMAAWRKAQG